MIDPTVLRGFSEANGSWKIICISRRSPRRSPPFAWVMSWPSNSIEPSVASYNRINTRASVDLPHPVSPTRPSVSPLWMSRSTPSTAWTSPIRFWNRIPG
jgi:hypothetical protein